MSISAAERRALLAGVRAMVPVLPGVVSFGMVVGLAMAAAGFPPALALLYSMIVYAGASQLAASQLVPNGTPILLILTTVVVINLRFMLYSASVRPYFGGLPLGWRIVLGCLVADNPYAMSMARFTAHPYEPHKHWFFLGAGGSVWLLWQAGTAAGVFLGAKLPAAWHLEFAAPLAFLAMVVPTLRDRAVIAAALAAGLVAVLAHGLPLRLGLLAAAVSGIAAGLLVEGQKR